VGQVSLESVNLCSSKRLLNSWSREEEKEGAERAKRGNKARGDFSGSFLGPDGKEKEGICTGATVLSAAQTPREL
jgi:hypothetical protein